MQSMRTGLLEPLWNWCGALDGTSVSLLSWFDSTSLGWHRGFHRLAHFAKLSAAGGRLARFPTNGSSVTSPVR